MERSMTIDQIAFVGDVDNLNVRVGLQKLIGAVIGEAIKPDATRRLASGRMNRPEDRGGESKVWLESDAGKYWLTLAGMTGVIDPLRIVEIAQNPNATGYDGNNTWA
jgi:hypothetical protein